MIYDWSLVIVYFFNVLLQYNLLETVRNIFSFFKLFEFAFNL